MTGEVRVPSGGVQVDEETPASQDTRETDGGELDTLRTQLEERTGDLQRVTAEYTNYRRRVERDRQAVAALAKAQVAGELLTVLDDIERAEAHGDLSGAFKSVADKLVAGLQAHGLEPFGAVGDAFDPSVHEAVQHDTSPDVDQPTVSAVLRRGYRFGDRVLRAALVGVTDAEPALSADAARTPGAADTPSESDGAAAAQDAPGGDEDPPSPPGSADQSQDA